MTVLTQDEATRLTTVYAGVFKASRRASFVSIASLVGIFIYLFYAWFAFDIPGLIEKSRLDRGVILALDTVAHKYHVTRTNKSGAVRVDVEGERDAIFKTPPAWITFEGDRTEVDLADGYTVTLDGNTVLYSTPDGRVFTVLITNEGIIVDGIIAYRVEGQPRFTAPDGRDGLTLDQLISEGLLPPNSLFTDKKYEVRPVLFKRLQVTKGRTQIHRYFYGWEYFFFAPKSPLAGYGAGGIWTLITEADRLDPTMSNTALVFHEFWTNPQWQHGDIAVALFETIIMALLGTMVAALVALPLAFAAAANFNTNFASRMLVRRFFDFVRGIDNLIWSLIFIRAFGLGPLTGIMAIAFTDTGTLGKLFSEAIENIDDKQVEGVRSTGASTMQRYRFGVIPQILPVFVSQTLYYLESNTRSATVIGALGAGGIGLKLVETLRTGKDWENTLYIIILTLMVVIAMDIGSGWLRRKLIGEKCH